MLYKDKRKFAFKNSDPNTSTVDEAEVSRFNRLAKEWWNPKGAFKVVHAFNAVRVKKLSKSLPIMMGRDCNEFQPLSGLSLLDVGCGAGIVSEPITKLGANVTAIDASERNILVAKQHARKSDINIDYQNALPEEITSTGQKFDIVISLEVIEHVSDPTLFLNILSELVNPGGALVIGTLNRTPISFIKAIIGAEYIMGWLPKGTHDWRKFVKPQEMDDVLLKSGFTVEEGCGVDFNPFTQKWQITKNSSSIYLRFYKHNNI